MCQAAHVFPNLKQAAFLQLPILTIILVKNKARSLWQQNLASEEGDEKLIIAPQKSVYLIFNILYII